MSTSKALLMSVLIPVTLAAALPASAFGRGGMGPEMTPPSFDELDANADGSLTLDEMLAHRDARLAEVDTDGDGNLSRDELIAAATARVAERVDAHLAQFDDNEDGMLSANERDDMRPRGPQPERIFSMMDADGDGSITAEEFETAQARFMAHRGEGRRPGMHGGEGHGSHGNGDGHGWRWGADDEG